MPTEDQIRLTTNTGETELERLLSGDAVFVIPYFQRPYRWKAERLKKLEEDLKALTDGVTDVHFLGAIIIHGRRGNPSDPRTFDVIDGQQRITTIFLYICAIVRVLCKYEKFDDARGLFEKYIAIPRQIQLSSNSRLHSCKTDRAQLNEVINELLSDAGLLQRLPHFQYRQLPTVGPAVKSRVKANFKAAVRFVEQEATRGGVEAINALLDALLRRVTVVQIDVRDPASGPKIFDSLNSSQEPMTIGDLVRNEIFAKVARQDLASIEAIDAEAWQPFAARFTVGDKNLFDDYFFPFGLIEDPNLKKSEVYSALRESWRTVSDPRALIQKLRAYQDAFLDLATGENRQDLGDSPRYMVTRLHRARTPAVMYPFLMQLTKAMSQEEVPETKGVEVMQLLESFVVRRAVCGIEPTGLHAVFKRLWRDCEGTIDAQVVERVIRDHHTVAWPSDEQFAQAIRERELYGTGIVRHVLYSWCESVGGELAPLTREIEVEHVLPQNPKPEWFNNRFDTESHKRFLNVLANLLLLTRKLNGDLANEPYRVKRPIYQDDAGFKATRKFAETYEEWNVEQASARASLLADWAVSRWRY